MGNRAEQMEGDKTYTYTKHMQHCCVGQAGMGVPHFWEKRPCFLGQVLAQI